MSYEAMHKVRASGLSDRTQVDVLEALAFFLNKETGACFPSTEAISRISRVNDRLVRTTLKTLHSLGLISSTQKAGQKRYFTLHLDRLPLPTPLQEVTGGQENAGGEESTPLYENTPLQESTGEGCRKIQGTPVGKCSTPLYETTPEQGINKESNKEEEQKRDTHSDAPVEGDLFNDDVKEIKTPKRPKTPPTLCPFKDGDQIPPQYLEYVKRKRPDIDAQTEFEKFFNYHAGQGNKKSDWLAAWRYWVGNIKTYSRQTQRSTNIRFEGHDNDFSCIYG